VIAVGITTSVLFVVVGPAYELQMYGDGSIFCYAVAVQDAWAFHWHNIAPRVAVYAYSLLPGEVYVSLTGDPRGGVFLYGLLQFAAPLIGLALTWMADRSPSRLLFTGACLSTACLCPLVFGFPTEMWIAHSLFWPALATAHFARPGIVGTTTLFASLLALVLTHEGAVVFGVAILGTLALRGLGDAVFLRAGGIFVIVMAIWATVKLTLPPDDYFSSALARAEFNFIDVANLNCAVCVLLFAAVAGYCLVFLGLRHVTPASAHIGAAVIVAAALVVYWLVFDQSLHTSYRYLVRTGLLIGTPLVGALAAALALKAEQRLKLPAPFLPRLLDLLSSADAARIGCGALLVVALVHTVETTKFVAAWSRYQAAVRVLATGSVSDPKLGDARFVSSERIGSDLNRLSWSSTTPYLSVLVAPKLAPARLVVDPSAAYFWLPCATAVANQEAERAVPGDSRRLVRVHACLHR
jgi:hypothetical protein